MTTEANKALICAEYVETAALPGQEVSEPEDVKQCLAVFARRYPTCVGT